MRELTITLTVQESQDVFSAVQAQILVLDQMRVPEVDEIEREAIVARYRALLAKLSNWAALSNLVQ
jgi:hypothetical protein